MIISGGMVTSNEDLKDLQARIEKK